MRTGSNAAHDDRLADGMRQQRALIAEAESDGAEQHGWKAGFGAPAARERFELDAPLVGALLDRTRLNPGVAVPIGTWRDARAEAEIAVLMGADVAGDATGAEAISAVAALAPAIELVDLHPAPESPSEALAGNIFHRHWITGAFTDVTGEWDVSDLVADIAAMGADLGPVDDVAALTGDAGETLAEIARIGARQGRGLRRGDVVILGAIVPPVPVAAGGDFRFALSGHAPIAVELTD